MEGTAWYDSVRIYVHLCLLELIREEQRDCQRRAQNVNLKSILVKLLG